MTTNLNCTESISAHLSILQNTIQRMAGNSANCKSWCITIVSAVIVIVADKGKPDLALLALAPILAFGLLDSFYLALEKQFRESYNQFVKKLHSDTISQDDFFVVKPSGKIGSYFWVSLLSISVWPFYLLLLVTTFTINWLL